jgi:hypothetical protein
MSDMSNLLKLLWRLRFHILTNFEWDVDEKTPIADELDYEIAREMFKQLQNNIVQKRFKEMDFQEFVKYTLRNYELLIQGKHKIIKRMISNVVRSQA